MTIILKRAKPASPARLAMRLIDRLFGNPVTVEAHRILLSDPKVTDLAMKGAFTARIVEDRDAMTVTSFETGVTDATRAALATLKPRGEKPLDGLFRLSQAIVKVPISDGGSPSATARAALWAKDRDAVAGEVAKAAARLRRIGHTEIAAAILAQSETGRPGDPATRPAR